jgi:hypothetical protein
MSGRMIPGRFNLINNTYYYNTFLCPLKIKTCKKSKIVVKMRNLSKNCNYTPVLPDDN